MRIVWLILLLFVPLTADSSIKAFEFESIEQEKRFQLLVAKLRCPTCQNQNLADSNSMVAEDLKQIVYEKLMAGDNDEQIIVFMKQRYGEFILYEPELSQSNLILWAGPFVFFIIAIGGFLIWFKHNNEVNGDD